MNQSAYCTKTDSRRPTPAAEGLNHEYMAQPGRLRRPGRGLKKKEESANSKFTQPPHTQKS
jgi:hypothetical protein